MSNFTFDVDVGNLSKGAVIKIQQAIDRGSDRGLENMRRLTHSMVLAMARKYDVPDSVLVGLDVRISEDGIAISISGADVMFVEYGTGMVGSRAGHPDASGSGWIYDVNSHGESGWWYPTTANDKNPTKKETDDGFIAWTKGMRSRPFMYETYLWAVENFNKIVTNSIESELKNLRL